MFQILRLWEGYLLKQSGKELNTLNTLFQKLSLYIKVGESMKIIIISSGILPVPAVNGGAVETLLDSIIEYNEWNHYHHDLVVYSIYDRNAKERTLKYEYCQFEYIQIAPALKKLAKFVFGVLNKVSSLYFGDLYIHKVIKKIKEIDHYDVVVVENICEYGLLLKKNGIHVVSLHLHNDYLFKGSRRSKPILDSYDKVFSISHYINSRIQSIYKSEKVVTLYNGINTNLFNKELYQDNIEELRNLYGLKLADIVLVFSGRLVPEKGICELLQAFVGLKDSLNIKLLVVGSSVFKGAPKNNFTRKLESLANQNKNNIIFTGYIPYPKMPAIYSIADIGIVPSVWEEPFGLTLIEQMAMSLPIITSDSGAIKEIVNEKCAIVVPRGGSYVNHLQSAMKSLITNEPQRVTLGKEARLRAEYFSENAYCANFFRFIIALKRNSANA